MVEDFKTGRIKVLVNVDVFSEGFDCPDVEFVQMARPTLSLAKYLQQAGRGLRKSTGKETCVLIDNVGALPCVRSAHHGMGLGSDVPWGYGWKGNTDRPAWKRNKSGNCHRGRFMSGLRYGNDRFP